MDKRGFKICLFVCTLVISSCVKEKDYPAEPIIKFKSFTSYGRDSADVVITFTDGDGDIGLDQGDTSGNFNSKSVYYNNMYLRYLYRTADGSFKAYEDPFGDTLDWKYRIPTLLSEGQQKRALSGEIKVKMRNVIAAHDTIQYDIYIIDRALHKSNVVNTGTIILN